MNVRGPSDSTSDAAGSELDAHSELALIVATAAEIHGHLSIGMVLQTVTEKVLPVLRADEASVMLLDRSTRQLRCIAASGQGYELVQGVSVELGEGIAGRVALDGRALILTEGEIDEWFSGMQRTTRAIYSAMCIPLIAVRETVGVLNITRARTRLPFTAADLESARLFGVHLAITIRRLQHLRLLERRLEGLGMAHRMRGRFLCALNHEVRTPLTVILGFTDILASRATIESEDREMIMQIGNNARRLASTLQEMQDLYALEGQGGRLRWSAGPLEAVAADCVADARGLVIGTDLQIEFEPDTSPRTVTIDAMRVKRALGHLLELLIRIAPPAGSIRVATGGSDGQAWIAIRPAADASALTDVVNEMNEAATGDGYIRSPASMEWTLLMVQDVVEAHGGRFTAAAGGMLRLSFPCSDVRWERF